MVGLLVEQLHHTAVEVGVKMYPDKDIRKRQELHLEIGFKMHCLPCMHVFIQIRVSV